MVVELTNHRVYVVGCECVPVQCTRELCFVLTSYTVLHCRHSLTLCYTILHDITLFYMMIHYLTLSYTITHYYTIFYTISHSAFLIVGGKLFFG